MCFIFHKWKKWQEYKRPILTAYGILAPEAWAGKELDSVQHRQKRICKECGKTQDRLIFKD